MGLLIDRVIPEIIQERSKQDERWGEQNHTPCKWLVILMEEVGEASKAELEQTMLKNPWGGNLYSRYREELVHVAAVAVAAIESFDRNMERKEK